MDLMLNFSNVYNMPTKKIKFIDCKNIRETNMYCTETAQNEIKDKLTKYSPKGIHFIDSGNYHYLTTFFTQKIKIPYSLILFDFHNDMQNAIFDNMISCGNWAKELLEKDQNLHQLFLIGPSQNTINAIHTKNQDKVISISIENIQTPNNSCDVVASKLRKFDSNFPTYLSIDKDVLSEKYARTNWNQGQMSLVTLKKFLSFFLKKSKIIGVDICGENSYDEPLSRKIIDEKINKQTDVDLYNFIKSKIN
ncbi:arginase family protein [Lachnobacterium bovis]|uniref:arginase family protein n=1 Tax=Lachnobacterium bovis TaxID=140626 RepID=UPI0003B37E71|nr:arginase family protein [Lachnobacterium bovis]